MNAHAPEPGRPHVSVWATGHRPSRLQRRGRYLSESTAHPAKMLPSVAAYAIATYTRPGDMVLDPMCGIGTTLVEAIHQGRHALGVELEQRWAMLAARNSALARSQGATGSAQVVNGNAYDLARLLPEAAGRVSLILTSPPYGAAAHGRVTTSRDDPGSKVTKWWYRYQDRQDPARPGNLAYDGTEALLSGFTHILGQCRQLLRPGGAVVISTRPYRDRGELIDLPGAVEQAATAAGLELSDRCAALIAGIRHHDLVLRTSFFQTHEARRQRTRGLPIYAIQHEDVLIFRRPPLSRAATAAHPTTGRTGPQTPEPDRPYEARPRRAA